MKFAAAFAFMFACLVASSFFIGMAECGKKKKILGALLLGAALAKKPKILPLPIPLPIPIAIKKTEYVPVPEPVYVSHGGYGGGYGGGGYGGYGGGY